MYEVREIQMTVRVERKNDEGKVDASGEIPVRVFEADFSRPVEDFVKAVLDQVKAEAAKAQPTESQEG